MPRRGPAVAIVSCGGTGTYPFSALVPGRDGDPGRRRGPVGRALRTVFHIEHPYALTVARPSPAVRTRERIVCDAGRKSMTSGRGHATALGLGDVRSLTLSAEHATLELSEPAELPRIGDQLDSSWATATPLSTCMTRWSRCATASSKPYGRSPPAAVSTEPQGGTMRLGLVQMSPGDRTPSTRYPRRSRTSRPLGCTRATRCSRSSEAAARSGAISRPSKRPGWTSRPCPSRAAGPAQAAASRPRRWATSRTSSGPGCGRGKLDGLALQLHGACSAVGLDDVEGYLVAHLSRGAGPGRAHRDDASTTTPT